MKRPSIQRLILKDWLDELDFYEGSLDSMKVTTSGARIMDLDLMVDLITDAFDGVPFEKDGDFVIK